MTINFHEHKMQDKIAGMAGSFWVRMCRFLFPPKHSQHHYGCMCCLLLAGRRVPAVMGSSRSLPWGKSWEPDLSCLQLTLISRLLQISHRGLIAGKFKLIVLVLLFSSVLWHLS